MPPPAGRPRPSWQLHFTLCQSSCCQCECGLSGGIRSSQVGDAGEQDRDKGSVRSEQGTGLRRHLNSHPFCHLPSRAQSRVSRPQCWPNLAKLQVHRPRLPAYSAGWADGAWGSPGLQFHFNDGNSHLKSVCQATTHTSLHRAC